MTKALSYNEREKLALRLYAAFLDIPVERLPELFKSRLSRTTMEQWERVAEVALGLRELRREKPVEVPRLIEPKSARAGEKAAKVAVNTPRNLNAPQWCDQCDRRVSPAEAKACQSRFCKVKGDLQK